MAKRFTLETLMKLAQGIGANPSKFMGTRGNITFLGKGPTNNPLFQAPVAGLETATEAALGPREKIIGAVEDAMGFASANKLNDIQVQALGLNLENIFKVYNPPPLPLASVSPIRSGIKTVAPKPMTDIERLMKEGYTDARGRRWDFGAQETGAGDRLYNKLTGLNKPRLVKSKLPEPGPEAFNRALNQKTGMSRAIARQILQQDTRLKLKPEELFMLKEGKGEPLDLMKKYYGKSMFNLDEFLDSVNLQAGNPRDLATRVLSEVELIPQFAEGGLAEILQAPRRGRVVHPGGYAGIPEDSDLQALIDWMEEQGYDMTVPLPGEHSTGKPKPKPTLHAKGGLARILEV